MTRGIGSGSVVRPSPIFLGILAVTVAAAALTLVQNQVAITAGVVLLVLGGWVVSLCLHEFGHAYVAYRGGDTSVRAKGYLDLDPRRYTDPVFSIVIPVLFLILGGIGLPGGAVWINHGMFRNKLRRTMVSLAGPAANLALAVLLIFAVQLSGGLSNGITAGTPLLAGLSFLALLQVIAFVLNILPIPGLDGWGAIEPYLSYEAQAFGAKARPWAPLILLVLLIAVPAVSSVFFDVIYLLFNAVGGDGYLSQLGSGLFQFWRQL